MVNVKKSQVTTLSSSSGLYLLIFNREELSKEADGVSQPAHGKKTGQKLMEAPVVQVCKPVINSRH